jgi:predicted amidophosphoribosyltransferase
MRNPNCNKLTYSMMDFKNSSHSKHKAAVNTFTSMLLPIIGSLHWTDTMRVLANEPFVIVICPSHEAGKVSKGLISVALNVCKTYNMGNYNQILVRGKTIVSAKNGGVRSEQVHMKSIKTINPHLIRDQVVFVLDDVTTTGCTLKACSLLLKSCGARHVEPIALLKTA